MQRICRFTSTALESAAKCLGLDDASRTEAVRPGSAFQFRQYQARSLNGGPKESAKQQRAFLEDDLHSDLEHAG